MLSAEIAWFKALGDELRSGTLTWSEAWIRSVGSELGEF